MLSVNTHASVATNKSDNKSKVSEKNTPKVPTYDDNMSIKEYLDQVEKYELFLRKEKYNVLLDFINKWLKYTSHGSKLRSLTEFTNISEKKLLADKKHNRKILRENTENIKKVFHLDNLNIDEETASDEITDKYIIYIVSKLLSLIEYTLSYRIKSHDTFYTIKLK